MEGKCRKLGGGPPRGISMHRDESVGGTNVAPTDQSDSSCRVA